MDRQRATAQQLPTTWDAFIVGEQIIAAFVTLDLMPNVPGPRKPGGHWPKHITEWSDQLAQAELEEWERETRRQTANKTVIQPSTLEITRMEMAFEWLRELNAKDSGMAIILTLWGHRAARGMSMKRLCYEKKWATRTFFRKRAAALEFLADDLNKRRVPVFC